MRLYEKYKKTNKPNDLFIWWLWRKCLSHIPIYVKYHNYYLGEYKKSYGHEYPDKIFYVIRPNGESCGLMSLYKSVIQKIMYADERGYIPVIDFKNYKNMYRDKSLIHKNSWEYYWKQPAHVALEEISKAKNVIIAAKIIDNIKNVYSKETISNVSQYIDMVPFSENTQKHLNVKYKEFIKKCGSTTNVLGVLARGTDYTSLQPHKHAVVPTVDQLFEKIEEKQTEWKRYSYIFLATEDENIYSRFKERYGNKLITSGQELYLSNTKGRALSQIRKKRKNDNYYRGLEYLTTVYLLSKCDALIGGNTAGTIAAMWWNKGEYKNTYLFDLGKYN